MTGPIDRDQAGDVPGAVPDGIPPLMQIEQGIRISLDGLRHYLQTDPGRNVRLRLADSLGLALAHVHHPVEVCRRWEDLAFVLRQSDDPHIWLLAVDAVDRSLSDLGESSS